MQQKINKRKKREPDRHIKRERETKKECAFTYKRVCINNSALSTVTRVIEDRPLGRSP